VSLLKDRWSDSRHPTLGGIGTSVHQKQRSNCSVRPPPFLALLPSYPIFCNSHKLTSSDDSAITPASNVIVNQKWLNLVTEEHALDRTIGVITKTDRIEETDHGIVRIIYAILIPLMLTWCIIDIQFA
jgi:hypothetical protein